MKTFLLIGIIALISVLALTAAYPIEANDEDYQWQLYYDDSDEIHAARQEELWHGFSDISDVTIPAKPVTAIKRPIGSAAGARSTPAPLITRNSAPATTPSTITKSSPSQKVHTKGESTAIRGPGEEAGQVPSSAGQTAGNSGLRPGATRPGGNRPGNNNGPSNSRPGNNRPGNNNNRPGNNNNNNKDKNKDKNKNKNSSEESEEDSNSQEESAEEPEIGSDETLEEES